MFLDKVSIKVTAGKGGNGCVSFFRAKYIVNGGPDGGDGGHGGNIVIKADASINSLGAFQFKRNFKAQHGADGQNRNKSGKKGENLILTVPLGTIIREANTHQVMADMHKPDSVVVIKGGKGGRGNQHFATSRRQAPRYAERGKDGQSFDLTLELKMIADVGLIGLPNAGKSSLLKMATNADPKIANYHFTTLSPNLGVVSFQDGVDFVMADIPGLIEGASKGEGLGHEFLRHVERCRLLVHVIDASGLEGSDPLKSLLSINHELQEYQNDLSHKMQIVAANKMDIFESNQHYLQLKQYCEDHDMMIFPISAATGAGIADLLQYVKRILPQIEKPEPFKENYVEEQKVESESFHIEKVDDDYFVVTGVGVEKMIGYTNVDSEKGLHFVQRYLKEKKIMDALMEAGLKEGDTVRIYNIEFEYFD